ncbi:MAG: hypothetical protein K6A34_01200 [Methanobrevibacter sp.]|nr:hypothetical protein [Methanobrevibacter sp.]
MRHLIEAYDNLMNGFSDVLEEMVEDKKLKKISKMGVTKGTPEMPFLDIYIPEPFTNIEDMGLAEVWEGEIIFATNVMNNKEPEQGIRQACEIISEVKDIITNSRRLEEFGIFYIKSKDFGFVPYAFGKNKNVYGAGITFTIRFKLANPDCKEE